jgi:hypothetical protein
MADQSPIFSVDRFLQLDISSEPIEPPYIFSHGLSNGAFHERKPVRHPKRRPRKSPPPSVFQSILIPLFSFASHTILPSWQYPCSLYGILYTNPYSFPQRKSKIQHYRECAEKHRSALINSPLATLFDDKEPTIFETMAIGLGVADEKEGRLRRCLRRFLHRLRLRRLARRPLNCDDPATLSPPTIPIVLHDWEARGIWNYEAASLRDRITAELTHVVYGFPTVLPPRNPLTNKEYTYGQLMSIFQQLRTAGKMNSILEGYVEVGCKNGVFQAVHWRKIRLHHFERVYMDERGDEFCEEFGGFLVEMIYTLVKPDFRLELDQIFHWAVRHAISVPYVQEWKGLYRQSQITEILYKDDPQYERMVRSIRGLASALFMQKKDFGGLKALWLRRPADHDDDDESEND